MQEMWVQSLGWKDPLEEGKATHSSILAWRIPRTEKPGGLQSIWSQRVRHALQYSCLENPMDGGAWLATLHGVAKTQDD